MARRASRSGGRGSGFDGCWGGSGRSAAAVWVTTGLSVGPAGQAVFGGLERRAGAATVAAALGGRGSGA